MNDSFKQTSELSSDMTFYGTLLPCWLVHEPGLYGSYKITARK